MGWVDAVPDSLLPEPWARLKLRAPSVKIEVRDTQESYGVGSRGPFSGPCGVHGKRSLRSWRILSHLECKITAQSSISVLFIFFLFHHFSPYNFGPPESGALGLGPTGPVVNLVLGRWIRELKQRV